MPHCFVESLTVLTISEGPSSCADRRSLPDGAMMEVIVRSAIRVTSCPPPSFREISHNTLLEVKRYKCCPDGSHNGGRRNELLKDGCNFCAALRRGPPLTETR